MSKRVKKIKKVLELLKSKNITDIKNIEVGFIICPIEYDNDLKYYWGYFSEIKDNVNIHNMIQGNCETLSISAHPHDLKRYKLFGIKYWEDVKTKYLYNYKIIIYYYFVDLLHGF